VHSLEEQLPALIEEITVLKPASTEIGHNAFKGSSFTRQPNPEGIRNVISRFVKKAIGSLD